MVGWDECRFISILQVYQYFTHYWPSLFHKIWTFMQHSLKLGGTNYHFKRVKESGTAPYWKTCEWNTELARSTVHEWLPHFCQMYVPLWFVFNNLIINRKFNQINNQLWPQQPPLTSTTTSDLNNHLWPQQPPLTSTTTSHLNNHLSPQQPPLTSTTTSHLNNQLSPQLPPLTSTTTSHLNNHLWPQQPALTSTTTSHLNNHLSPQIIEHNED